MIHPLLIGLMIGIGDLRCGFGGGELKDRSSEFLEIGDFLCGVGGRGGQAGRETGSKLHQDLQATRAGPRNQAKMLKKWRGPMFGVRNQPIPLLALYLSTPFILLETSLQKCSPH